MAEDLLHKKQFPPYTPKRGEEYMSAKQLTHFRDILASLKDELSEDIERTVHTMQDEATVFADPNDRASQESDIALELRNRDRERKLIKKIDESIARIEKRRIRLLRLMRRRNRPQAPRSPPDGHALHRLQDLEEHREKQVGK
jgi:DnaK suppressor protein